MSLKTPENTQSDKLFQRLPSYVNELYLNEVFLFLDDGFERGFGLDILVRLIEFSLDGVAILSRGAQFILRFSETPRKFLRHAIHFNGGVVSGGVRVRQLLPRKGDSYRVRK